ncbi:MAG: bifunctional diaminohydroxyphosphoribosylaminopyrimidine deaminase/5-amino-6-(5-phosphoribosylamino)uracil reductase RibD, partial [Rickettsiales bacterium]
GANSNGATLYVTLEPCSHHGKTPPCVDAIIAAVITTVIVACRDKNPQVNSAGISALKNANIKVIENICEKEALEINRGFFSVIEKNRPYIALKIATSLDEKITSPQGQWLTGEHARNYGHLLRSQYDAILTGSGTVLADNPLLTCRLSGLENRSPMRIVLDRNNRIPKNAKILTEQNISPTLVISEPTIAEAINKITQRGITSILVEAGAKLTSAFLESGIVDKVYWFSAPITIGEEGVSVTTALEKLVQFKQIEHIALGNDSLDILDKI